MSSVTPGAEVTSCRPLTPAASTDQERNPWLVLIVLCAAIFMLLLDTTIVNVAQRKIQAGLDADLTQIQ